MKTRQLIWSALLLCCFSGPALCASGTHALPRPKASAPVQALDGIVAYVNNGIITQSEVDDAYKAARQQQQHAQAAGLPNVPKHKLKELVMDQLIAQKLQLQMAKQNNLIITNKQLNNAVAEIAKQHKLSVKQLYKAVTKTGLSHKTYREQLRKQITIMTLQRGVVGKKANVTPAEIKAYKDAHGGTLYQVGDILIPLSANPSHTEMNQASQKADVIKNALKQSHDFHKVAERYSPSNFNVLTWRPLTDLPDLFASSLESTKVNASAGPIRAPNGLHVLYLIGKKIGAHPLSDEQAHMMLFQQKSEKVIVPWIKKLRESSDVRIITSP